MSTSRSIRFRMLLLVALLGLTLLGPERAATAQPASPPPTTDEQLQAVMPTAQNDLGTVIDAGLTAYTIDLTMTPDEDAGRLTGEIRIDYVNSTEADLDEIPLRMFANGDVDPMTITSAEVAGTSVDAELSVSETVATLPLDESLPIGGRVDLAITYQAEVPFGNQIHYGIFGIDEAEDTWALAHWYPMVAGWVDGDGWQLDPPSVNGDAIFSTTSTYDVTIEAPQDFVLVTTGVEIARDVDEQADTQSNRFVTGPVRDFTIVADDRFQVTTIEVDGTRVNSWYLPGEEINGEMVAEYAARSLAYFNEEIGSYPFVELDVLSVEVYGALGVEFPQLIYMARDYYTQDIELDAPNNLEFTVAHEVLHQWWYAMVGNNQYDHAFIDEGLTNYISGDLYFRYVYGEEAGEAFSLGAFRNSYERGLESRGDQIVDMPTDDYSTGGDYVYAMYFKAAVGFSEIQDEIGRDAFFEGLRLYFERFRFAVAEPDDLLQALEDASGEDLDDLWELWFEETAST